jgi:1,4-dihydroxy-2-naphthoate octaprenyltransferase
MSLRPLTPRRRHILAAWWQAARPPYYIATLVPLFLGWVQAGRESGQWRPGLFALALLCCFFLHLATNLANDLFDHLQGIDAGGNIGGSRAIQEGKISLAGYVKALVILYGGALLMAAAGVWHTGHTDIWGIVGFAIFASLFYVAPPIRYGHRALGELFVFLSMGVVMTAGTDYTITGIWSPSALALSIPVGLMVAGILYYQSLPEIETDKAVGKHTLANVLGPARAILLFRLWWPIIWLFLLLFWLIGLCNWLALIGIALSIPCYVKVVRLLRNVNGDWLSLDAHGHLVRKMYLACGLALIFSVYWR